MKEPYLQFYTGDFLRDPGVRSVSLAARGLWIDLLCLMHQSVRRGYLQHPTGLPFTPVQLARMVGHSVEEIASVLQELEDSGVFSRTRDGVIFSRRMDRDERKRQLCSQAGKRGGGNPALTQPIKDTFKGESKGGDKGESKGGVKPQNQNQNPEEPDGSKKRNRARGEKVEVVGFVIQELDLPASDGEWFFDRCEGNGWKNGGEPIKDWRATLRAWKTAGYLPSLKSAKKTNGNHARTTPDQTQELVPGGKW